MIFDTYHSRLCQELIETLWNVNSIDVVIDNIRDIELIETLWNVNLHSRPNKLW